MIKARGLGVFILLLCFFSFFATDSFAKGKKVHWSQENIEINGEPGDSFSIDVQFESEKSLSKVFINVIPELQPFISVTPSYFKKIKKGEIYSIDVDVSIPHDTVAGLYDGIVYLEKLKGKGDEGSSGKKKRKKHHSSSDKSSDDDSGSADGHSGHKHGSRIIPGPLNVQITVNNAQPEVGIETGQRVFDIPVGTTDNVSFVTNFQTASSNVFNIDFSQSISPNTGGISINSNSSTGWTADTSSSWVVSETITGNTVGTYEITTLATINETGESDQVTTIVNVISDEGNPIVTPLGSVPNAISISMPTDVLFTTKLSNIDLQPLQVTLEGVDQTGNPLGTLGWLVDDGTSGDLLANDNVFSGTFSIDSDTEGMLCYRAQAAFTGITNPVLSDIYKLAVTRFPTDIKPLDATKIVVSPEFGTEIITNEIIVKFIEGTSPDTIESVINSIGGTVVGSISVLGVYQVEIADTADDIGVKTAITILLTHPEVEVAEPNTIKHTDAVTPNDTKYVDQWGLRKIRADEAWVIARGSGIIIAILDSGVDYNHEDLVGKVILGRDFGDGDNDPIDANDHGTHVAGIAAASTNTIIKTGIAGVAWDSKILAIKVEDSLGNISDLNSASGLISAVFSGAKVINMSYGGGANTILEKAAAIIADDMDRLVVAAAGNDNCSDRLYPAAHDSVLAVGATGNITATGTYNDDRAIWTTGVPQCTPGSGSNFGTIKDNWVNIAAPGTDIWSTIPNNGYDTWNGTSMATPFVSGAAAVLWSLHPDWSDEQIRERLVKTAKPLPGQGLGAGRIDLFDAIFNASFEIDLDEWTVTGDGIPQSKSALGPLPAPVSLSPTDKNRMAYIDSAPVFGTSTGYTCLSQSFKVQPDVTAIPFSFDYNYITDGFGTSTSNICDVFGTDTTTISVKTPVGGKFTLVKEGPNCSLLSPAVGGVNLPGGDGDGSVNITGWTSVVSKTVSLTDFGTDTATSEFTTLEICVPNGVGTDTAAILIDNIRFK